MLQFKTVVFQVVGRETWAMGTGVLVRTQYVHLPTASKKTTNMILQNILNHVPNYTVSYPRPNMNPHHFQHLKSYTKEY